MVATLGPADARRLHPDGALVKPASWPRGDAEAERLLVLDPAAGTMAVAQLLFAIAPTFGMALLARTLLGVGDAMVFVSLLRYATEHFAVRRYPVVIALSGTLGALGAIVATVPLTVALESVGWTPSFLAAAAASAVAGGLRSGSEGPAAFLGAMCA